MGRQLRAPAQVASSLALGVGRGKVGGKEEGRGGRAMCVCASMRGVYMHTHAWGMCVHMCVHGTYSVQAHMHGGMRACMCMVCTHAGMGVCVCVYGVHGVYARMRGGVRVWCVCTHACKWHVCICVFSRHTHMQGGCMCSGGRTTQLPSPKSQQQPKGPALQSAPPPAFPPKQL